MKKNLWLVGLLALGALAGCTNQRTYQEELRADATDEVQNLKSGATPFAWQYGEPIPGRVIIQVSEELLGEMKLSNRGEMQMNSVPSRLQTAFNNIKASKAERLFPYDPRYEGRKKRMGMHLWYVVTIDEGVEMSEAMLQLGNVPGVTHVEYEPVMQKLSDNSSGSDYALLNYMDRGNKLPFNDPLLKDQWHYNNTGSLSGSKVGADINLFKAWEVTTGKPEVIVCVVDGGIDITHSDLKANLWVNEAELNGEPGKDDDGNGYIDDIHGYNFADNNAIIVPDDDYHGTHVAGTVAAVNNNGIGVAGVAGGNGTPGTGTRLMSANVFAKGKSQGGFASAIVYGADNGAVISQNSWGSRVPGTTPKSYQVAIDYFRKNAGCDDNGNQLPNSPMKGGVVIIASGNENSGERYSPGEYEPAIAVNAMAPDFTKASYSNYGEWTDITAPGGDQAYFGIKGGVLSTLRADTYGFYNGTSMACPHVSGVAALAVATHGGPGFTALELEEILLASILPVDIDEMNPVYAGKMGVGYIDAYAAVTIRNRHKAPEAPKLLPEKSVADNFFSTTIYWTVPKDEDDGAASKYLLYYSDKKLTEANYKKVGIQVGNVRGYVNGVGKQAGDEMSYTIRKLNHSTTYYVALVAIDRWGLESKPTFGEAKTKVNNPPQITNLPTEPIALVDALGSLKHELKVEDPEGHKWNFKLSGDQKGVSAAKSLDGNTLVLTIRSVLDEGTYNLGITLVDELGSEKAYEIPFRIIKVRKPELQTEFPDLVIGVNNAPLTIDLNNHFKPEEYLTLSFTGTSSDGTLVAPTLDEKGILTLTAYKPGEAVIGVKATNGYQSTDAFFNVKVTQDTGKDVYSVWPLPMKNELNVWVNPNVKQPKVTLRALNGRVVLSERITPDATGVAKLDVKKVAPGSYQLLIEGGSSPYKQTVLKR